MAAASAPRPDGARTVGIAVLPGMPLFEIAVPMEVFATPRPGRNIRRLELPVALQAPVAISQNEPPAAARIAGKALAAQLARHIAQAAAGLIADGASGQQPGDNNHQGNYAFVHKAALTFSRIIDIFTPNRRPT